MNSIDLGGHSGCRIYLYESDDGRNYVRKVSKNREYNPRLKAQCDKQDKYKGERIKAPKVFGSGINEEGLFYFDMEYIQGITLAEYIRSMEIGKIRGLVNSLVENICIYPESRTLDDANAIFARKLNELNEKLAGKNETIDEAITLLFAHDWSAFKPSFCHGDMTLENIIVRNDELYLIDFLDSFYDSYLMDLGTLLQDIQVMWSYRRDQKSDMNLIIRLIVFRDLIMDAIREKDVHLEKEVYFALLHKLVRILPYTKDELTWNFLIDKIAILNGEVK